MPLWVYGLQVVAMLGLLWLIVSYSVMLFVGSAFGGWHWSDIKHVAAIAAGIALFGFLLYTPDAVWRLFQLVPLPPSPTIEAYR